MQDRIGLTVGVVLLVSGHTSLAGGFYVSELGTPGSLGTAGVANVTNNFGADAAWTNPAGMTGLKQDTAVAGVQLIVPNAEFDSSVAENVVTSLPVSGGDGGNAGMVSVAPSHFLVKSISDDVKLGFSVAGTMGGGLDYGKNFVGRYATYRAVLAGVALSPSIAYKVDEDLSIGAGVSAVYTQFDQDIAVRQPGNADGRVSINQIDDWGFTSFFGLTYQLNDKTLLGVVYRPEFDADLEGDVNFSNFVAPTPTADSIEVEWTNPQVLRVGLQYELDDEYTLFFDADWEDWSEFSENRLAFDGGKLNPVVTLDRNWKDTYHLGVAVARRWAGQHVSLGISYDSSPVDDDDRTIDLPLDEQLKLSASYGRDGKSLDYSIGATLIYLGEGKVDQQAQGVRVKGEFDTNYALFFGGTLRYDF